MKKKVKKFCEYYGGLITIIAAVLIAAAFAVWFLVCLYAHSEADRLQNTHTLQAVVVDTGYSGITVEYQGEYGGTVTRTIDTQETYFAGDTVTIAVYGKSATIAGDF